MEYPTPSYAGAYPFTVTRTVKWGDCDPAGIIYTPRVLDYAMEILEAWYREVVGVPWLVLNPELEEKSISRRCRLREACARR